MDRTAKQIVGGRLTKSKRTTVAHRDDAKSKAIVPAHAAQLTTERPTIQALVNNVEEVRRFVQKHLNVELQKFQAKHKPPKADDKEAMEKWEKKISDLEIDWGTIPGVGKPFLKQPGAEKFCLWLQLRPKYMNREFESAEKPGHMEIVSKVILYSKKTQEEVFEGPECSCSTMESNYRYRMQQSALKPEKAEADRLKSLGIGRWKPKAVWAHGKKTGTEWVWYERVENPNIWDERNKVRQIGEKRALVKCVRGVGAMSEIFTSDPNEWDDVRADGEEGDPYLDMDFTPGGRRVVDQDGKAPGTGKPVTHEAKKAEGRKAAQAVAEEKVGKKPDSSVGADTEQRDPFNGVVEIDQTNENDPMVRGDIAALLPVMQKNFRIKWSDEDKAWHVDPRDVESMFEMCRQLSYHYFYFIRDNEGKILKFADGKRIKETAEATSSSSQSEAPKGEPTAQPETATPLKTGESLVTGTVKDVFDKITTGQAEQKDKDGKVIRKARPSVPYLNLLFKDKKNRADWLNVFDHDMFPHIMKAKQSGAECVFVTKKSGNYTNITGLIRIGTQEFHDGKIPTISVDREPGTRTLFPNE